MVGLVAAAGGGKSRLLYALRQRLAGARLIYLTSRCLLYGSTIPYYPLMDCVRTSVSQNQTGNTPYLESCPRTAPLGWAALWTLT